MGERKVLNKYIPPTFDPSLIPSSSSLSGKKKFNNKKKDKYSSSQHGIGASASSSSSQTSNSLSHGGRRDEVRMMLPFSLRCLTCNSFSYQGTKVNSKKEIAKGEDYLGIAVHRFFVKCPSCKAEIIFKTDPKHADYVLETGATRNYQAWRETNNDAQRSLVRERDFVQEAREKEIMEAAAAKASSSSSSKTGNSTNVPKQSASDAMAALEMRAAESKKEMERADALGLQMSRNAARENVDLEKIVSLISSTIPDDPKLLEEQDEEEVRKAFAHKRKVRRLL